MERDDNFSFSELPDNILLHIMSFMDTKSAVRTCVLSKRWINLCKNLTNLSFSGRWPDDFDEFVSWVVSNRNDAYSLLNLAIENQLNPFDHKSVDRIIKYAVNHNVEQLKVDIVARIAVMSNSELLPLIFSCQSLKSLQISIRVVEMFHFLNTLPPRSFNMPVLKYLNLSYVRFSARYNDLANPFSKCPVLDTLVLRHCSLHDHEQVLHISNATLSNLTIFEGEAFKIELSTPNISVVTFKGCANHQLSSTCNLSSLEEVNIFIYGDETSWDGKSSIIIGWLKVLANVKILTFSLRAVRVILRDLSNPNAKRPEVPCFARLEIIKVKKQFFADISDEEVNTVVKYLLQNSPSAMNVDIIKNA